MIGSEKVYFIALGVYAAMHKGDTERLAFQSGGMFAVLLDRYYFEQSGEFMIIYSMICLK